MELTHNPPFYGEFLEHYGFRKAKDYHAYIMDVQEPPAGRLKKVVGKVRQRRDIQTRPLILKELESG
mgnify:CR=1 FL=1